LTYKTYKGNNVPVRILASEITSSKYRCADNSDEIERGQIFSDYWSLGDNITKQDFLCSLINEYELKTSARQQIGSAINVRRKLYLDMKGRRERVYKEHFVAIRNISTSVIDTVLSTSQEVV
jgi:hypothetical protein